MTTAGSIAVYAASSAEAARPFLEAAAELGAAMAERGVRLVYGAGKTGLMGALAGACLAAGGKVTGVIPRFMAENGWCREGLDALSVTPCMHTRKKALFSLGDAAIALPGGCGTLEELLETITWKQLGLYSKPVVVLNTCGFYDPLLEMLGRAIDNRLMSTAHRALWSVARTPDEALRLAGAPPARGRREGAARENTA